MLPTTLCHFSLDCIYMICEGFTFWYDTCVNQLYIHAYLGALLTLHHLPLPTSEAVAGRLDISSSLGSQQKEFIKHVRKVLYNKVGSLWTFIPREKQTEYREHNWATTKWYCCEQHPISFWQFHTSFPSQFTKWAKWSLLTGK